ncbi:MAG: NIPSNAP family protein [Candidatus Limnocylindria bacterium]
MTRPDDPGTSVLDIRTYKLVPGGRDEFDRIFRESALPMLHRFGIQVVAYGPSLDDDHYCLVRAFPSAARREEQLDSLYGSDEWRQNYRDAVIALIDAYHVVVIRLTPGIRQGLAELNAAAVVRSATTRRSRTT